VLEQAGLVTRRPEAPRVVRDRFRGRLIFPIHDLAGRPVGFGGRILPEFEAKWAEAGHRVAKYLNTPETPLFQKRRMLYAADLARPAARAAGWVAVVEGYTDVIAAHQVGLANVVGTLGTALGDAHVQALRRLADRVVLVFDGDEAGQKAADRALELFLSHEVDVRVLSLPAGLDPCDFLLEQGADAFRALVDRAVDPLDFALNRAAARFDFDSIEEARQAADWVLSILARVPRRDGIDLKLGKALNNLSGSLNLPVDSLRRRLSELGRPAKAAPARVKNGRESDIGLPASSFMEPIRISELNVLDRELVSLVLNEPSLTGSLITRVAAGSLREAPLRTILQACYDLYAEGQSPTFDRVALRLDDSAVRTLAAGLILPTYDPSPIPENVRPAPPEVRLAGLLVQLAERDRQDRLRDLKAALDEIDPIAEPDDHRALWTEYFRLLNRLDTKAKSAS
jgi:DNA primase